jgi:hypothetical protein
MTESSYGLPIHTRVLPLLDRTGSRSVLAGDYIGGNHQQDVLYEILAKQLVPIRDITFRYSNQFYIVYINNLTDAMVSSLQEGLADFGPFAGIVDTTYASRFKWYLSTILPQLYIQHRTTIISGHEDDRPDVENVNLPGLPFEEFGYNLRSLPGYLQGVLLSYKIERPVLEGFEVDTEFSINAVNPNPIPIETFTIEFDERKFEYLASEKAESLRKIGLLGGDLTSLRAMIQEKIASNYIYSMAYCEKHHTTQFNIILEATAPDTKPFRVLVGLEYIPNDKRLRLITMF